MIGSSCTAQARAARIFLIVTFHLRFHLAAAFQLLATKDSRLLPVCLTVDGFAFYLT